MKIKKFFASPGKEQKWLNDMAQSGYAFVKREEYNYYFEPDEDATSLSYSVEFLELVADTEESKQYFATREEAGEHYICSSGLKAYFVTKGNFSSESEINAVSTLRVYLRDRALVFGSVYLLLLGLLTYNLIMWIKFDAMGYVSTDSLPFIRAITVDLSSILGDYPTTPMIAFLLPLLVLVFVPTFWFLDEYISAKKVEKKLMKRLITINDQTQAETENLPEATENEIVKENRRL